MANLAREAEPDLFADPDRGADPERLPSGVSLRISFEGVPPRLPGPPLKAIGPGGVGRGDVRCRDCNAITAPGLASIGTRSKLRLRRGGLSGELGVADNFSGEGRSLLALGGLGGFTGGEPLAWDAWSAASRDILTPDINLTALRLSVKQLLNKKLSHLL